MSVCEEGSCDKDAHFVILIPADVRRFDCEFEGCIGPRFMEEVSPSHRSPIGILCQVEREDAEPYRVQMVDAGRWERLLLIYIS